jgi:hypothetical protein
VDDPAIVPCLVPSHSRFFLENHHAQPRKPLAHLHGKRKPNNPAANDRNVISHEFVCLVWGRASRPSKPCKARPPTENNPISQPAHLTVTQEQWNVTQKKARVPSSHAFRNVGTDTSALNYQLQITNYKFQSPAASRR